MKTILDFLLNINKLKENGRRGWTIHKIKNPETTAEHIFHLAILVWVLGKRKKIDLNKAIKMALIHDICEVYSPDFTAYDAAALKEKGRITIKEVMHLKPKPGRPTLNQRKRLEKIKQKMEMKAMKKLLADLPKDLRLEFMALWLDYERGLSRESRFVRQADKMINLLQGLEYWKKHGKIKHRLWIRRAKEILDDPEIIQLLKLVENKFCA